MVRSLLGVLPLSGGRERESCCQSTLRKVVACHTLFPWCHPSAIPRQSILNCFEAGRSCFCAKRLQCHCAGQPSIAWFKATGESFATSEANGRINLRVPGEEVMRNRSNYLGASK